MLGTAGELQSLIPPQEYSPDLSGYNRGQITNTGGTEIVRCLIGVGEGVAEKEGGRLGEDYPTGV